MKKIYLFFLILLFAGTNAQIVNIPDANFKAYLLAANTTTNQIAFKTSGASVIDTNSNGEIELSEAQSINVRLTIKNNSLITSLSGIENFINTPTVEVSSLTNLTSLDLNSIPQLKFVYLTNLPQITTLNFSAATLLNTLGISSVTSLANLNINSPTLQKLSLINDINLSQLDMTNCPMMKDFYVEGINIGTVNLSNLTSLIKVDLRSNPFLGSVNLAGSNNLTLLNITANGGLASLDISNKSVLTQLTCSFNPSLQTLSVSNCNNLTKILANSNNLSNISLGSIALLQELTVSDNNLTTLNLGNLPLLNYLQCSDNNLTSLNLTTLPALKFLYCYDNNLTSIDAHSNPALQSLFCADNSYLQYINIKNGSQNPVDISFISNTPALTYVCSDPEDITYYSSIYNLSSNNVVINSYCSFAPGGTFYTVQGNTKYDNNNNGCDTSDPLKPFQKFTITNGSANGNIISNTSGNYFIPVQAGTHTITPILENPTYFTVSPASFSANFPAQTSPLTQNFCITANGNHNDLETAIIPITAAVPGFTSKYKIIYKNKGTAAQSGTLAFSYDDNLMNFITATVAPASQSTSTLNWNFTNLLPFETREVTLNFTLNTPTATPPLAGGQILNYSAQVTGATDETPADNSFTLNQTVVNSFDPNDKTCLHGTAISQTQVGDYVHYLIRFENTGTANAQNVVVKDIIDTTKFNLSSLVAVAGSHSFVTRITGPNTVEFIFENIQLPFADATNDGYVVFKIRTLTNLTVGNAFSNTANIYFDYNAPIVTNTYTTTVQSNLSTTETATEDFSIYPNPVKDLLHFKTKERIVKAEVYDLSGRIVLSSGIIQNATDLSGLSKGNYLIRIYTKDQFIIKKLIKE